MANAYDTVMRCAGEINAIEAAGAHAVLVRSSEGYGYVPKAEPSDRSQKMHTHYDLGSGVIAEKAQPSDYSVTAVRHLGVPITKMNAPALRALIREMAAKALRTKRDTTREIAALRTAIADQPVAEPSPEPRRSFGTGFVLPFLLGVGSSLLAVSLIGWL